jgi:hypothetical protein
MDLTPNPFSLSFFSSNFSFPTFIFVSFRFQSFLGSDDADAVAVDDALSTEIHIRRRDEVEVEVEG